MHNKKVNKNSVPGSKDLVNTGNHKTVAPVKVKIEPYNPDGYK
jgi:hypothetical protein